MNEFSNTNFNLYNNIDISNKMYNGNNSNLLINSDRTFNFSGNNCLRKNNNRNNLARLLNGNDSINFNSIISGKIDKSNDFFFEFGLGKKQGRNTFNEIKVNRKELIKISKENNIYKTGNLNNDIQGSNSESNINNDNNINKLIGYFEQSVQDKYIYNTYNPCNEYELNNEQINLNLNQSFDINIKSLSNRKTENYLNKNTKNCLIKHSSEENDFNHNEDKKTGKFFFTLDEKQKREKDNNYKNEDEKNIEKISFKNFLLYFCFLLKLYMRKKLFKACILKINEYKKSQDRKYGSKMIYRIIKRRILFFKIKFYRRLKKIRKYYIKYNERLNLLNKRKNTKTKK